MIENILRRATKLALNLKKLFYKERLEKLGLTTLKMRRERRDTIQYFKIVKGLNKVEYVAPNIISPALMLNRTKIQFIINLLKCTFALNFDL